MIIYEHTFPSVAIGLSLLLALLIGLASAWKYLPRNRGSATLLASFLLTLLIVGWALLLPGHKNAVTQVIKPRFVIAFDTSKSMSLSPTKEIPSRWQTAMEALHLPWLQKLSAECDVELYPFSSGLGENIPLSGTSNLKPEGTQTLIRDTLKQVADRFTGLNLSGLLLLTDGVDTHEALDDWTTAERTFPIYTVALEPNGSWQQEPDLRIDAVTTSRRVNVGWKSDFKVKVSGQGTGGTPVMVQVYENGQLRAEKPTQIPNEGGEREVAFEFDHPKVGTFNYRVFVPHLEGEKNKEDNEHLLDIEVTDARNRLLYVEGIPRWEYKYLRRTLLGERQISPVLFFTGPDGKPQGGTPVGEFTADMNAQQLAFFKIVMLGNLDASELGEQRAANLLKFVENGGSLVLLGGAKAWCSGGLLGTELAKALPVRAKELKTLEGEKPFLVKLTEEARSHPAFSGDAALWKTIPPVLSVFSGVELSPSAQSLVLADTPTGTQPLVVTQRFGQGKVTAILTDSLWRWQLGPEAAKAKPYERFWTQLVSWLLPREDAQGQSQIELFADRDQLFLGETVELRARLGEEGSTQPESVDAKVTLPDGRTVPYRMAPQQVTTSLGKSFPGYGFSFKAETAGQIKVVASGIIKGNPISSQPLTFFVKPYSPETAPRPAKIEVLQALSQTSGGKWYENIQRMNEGLAGLQLKATEETTAEYNTLWRRWPVLLVLMGMLAASWASRKFKNMP